MGAALPYFSPNLKLKPLNNNLLKTSFITDPFTQQEAALCYKKKYNPKPHNQNWEHFADYTACLSSCAKLLASNIELLSLGLEKRLFDFTLRQSRAHQLCASSKCTRFLLQCYSIIHGSDQHGKLSSFKPLCVHYYIYICIYKIYTSFMQVLVTLSQAQPPILVQPQCPQQPTPTHGVFSKSSGAVQ